MKNGLYSLDHDYQPEQAETGKEAEKPRHSQSELLEYKQSN